MGSQKEQWKNEAGGTWKLEMSNFFSWGDQDWPDLELICEHREEDASRTQGQGERESRPFSAAA